MGGKIRSSELSDVVWQTSHSIETRTGVEFAWRYWSDVTNWNDPPARFEIVGPFVTRARRLTHLPRQPPIEWFVRDVQSCVAATIEIPADDATISFQWKFESVGMGRTLLTQRIMLYREKAATSLDHTKDARRKPAISHEKNGQRDGSRTGRYNQTTEINYSE